MNERHAPSVQLGQSFEALVKVIYQLRAECPWYREQTRQTLAKYLLEEAYETVAAFEGDPKALGDELGDLLLQVILHARLSEETGTHNLKVILEDARGKLIRRHPHVFGPEPPAQSAAEVERRWEQTKRAERQGAGLASALDDVPRHLAALLRAEKLGYRARAEGMDWADLPGVLAKVREELAEIEEAYARGDLEQVKAELGDCLLALANAPRFIGHSVEQTLHQACDKFERRFRMVERLAREAGLNLSELSSERIDALWRAAKARA